MNDINVKVKEEQDAHRVLSIQISSSRVKKEKEKIVSQFQKKAKIPGFRPGKIPKQLIETKFGDDIKLELMETILSSAYREALEAQELVPISRPKFSNVESSVDSSMSFEAAFDVRPDVEVKRYTSFVVDKKLKKVTEEDIERALKSLSKEKAVYRPVDRPARIGDLIFLEYSSVEEDGKSPEDNGGESAEITLGEGEVLRDIEDGIVGMSAGEEKEIEITYPDDYYIERLRGKGRKLKINVSEVKEVIIPTIDDEFARSIHPSKDLEHLKEEIKNRLEKERERQAREEVVEKIIDLVIEANPFEPPKIIVENYLDEFLQRMKQERQRSGQDFDIEKVRNLYRPAAVRLYKKNFVLDSIARAEELTATEEEIEEELKNISKRTGKPLSSIKRDVDRDTNSRERIRYGITFDKVAEFLLNNSEVRTEYE